MSKTRLTDWVRAIIFAFILTLLTACEVYGAEFNFVVNLTNSSHTNYREVVVSVKRVLLKVSGSSYGNGKNGTEIVISENVGPINLMDLENGVKFDIGHLNLPAETKVNQVRLILEDEGHHFVTYEDGTRCFLQTPSQQNTGLKVVNPQFIIKANHDYAMAVDFVAEKSIVNQGKGKNAGCLLKPVIQWAGVDETSVTPPQEPEEEDPVVEDPVVEDPVVEDPVVEDPVVEDPVVVDPVVEDPVVQDPPVVEDPVVEDPVVQDPPVVEDPVVEDPVVQDPPVVEDPVVEDPVVQDPPVVEDPVVEDPVVQDPPAPQDPMEMCQNVTFDLYDQSTWPADFNFSDYEHCY